MLISRKITLFAASADPYLGSKFAPQYLALCAVVVLGSGSGRLSDT